MSIFLEKEHVQFQQAYVLHQKPYRNTSAIIDVLTEDYGRISLVAKGAKKMKSPFKGSLQPFQRLAISWVRRSELGTLTHAEIIDCQHIPKGEALFAAMYLNELLIRVLIKTDAPLELFQPYHQALISLYSKPLLSTLRIFEYQLLQALGFEMQLNVDAESEQINPELKYKYIPEHGFVISNEKNSFLFAGKDLIAFSNEDFSEKSTQQTSQILMRIGLKRLIGEEPLKSRELFKSYKEQLSYSPGG